MYIVLIVEFLFFFFKQKTAYEMRISDWSSDVCSSDLFTPIYHELGHVYYYLAYNKLPPLFQAGANDGFHEAIGDTIVLAMTPEYLHSIEIGRASCRERVCQYV